MYKNELRNSKEIFNTTKNLQHYVMPIGFGHAHFRMAKNLRHYFIMPLVFGPVLTMAKNLWHYVMLLVFGHYKMFPILYPIMHQSIHSHLYTHCGLKVRLNFFKSNAKNELGP